MIRNLKTLPFALAAVLAVSALAAPTALAQSEQGELTTENAQDVTLDITETRGETLANSFTAFGETIHCPGTTFVGHKWNVTPHVLIPNGSTTFTVTKKPNQPCHVSGGRQATINMHGCDFVFTIRNTTPAGNKNGTYGVEHSVGCPVASEGITFTIFGNTPPSAEGSDLCTVEMTGNGTLNNKLHGAHLTNQSIKFPTTKDYLDLTGSFTGIHVERTGLCAFLGNNTNETAAFNFNYAIKGTDAAGNEIGITVTDTVF